MLLPGLEEDKTRIKAFLHSKSGEFFLGVGVKILIAVVVGSVFLGGTYSLMRDNVMANVESKIRVLSRFMRKIVCKLCFE